MPDQDWKALAESLTEEALILRLKSTEHDFVERKPRGQKGEWLQTAVAFANSAPIGWPAVLFVGVDDDGKPQQQADQMEALIRSISDVIGASAYPPIYRHIVPLELPGEGACVAVIIPGSPARPHFAGQSYIRVGDSTKKASEEQYDQLIADRQSKAHEIRKYVGASVSLWHLKAGRGEYQSVVASDVTVIDCNSHYVTISKNAEGEELRVGFPLAWAELSFDYARSRLAIIIPATHLPSFSRGGITSL